MHSKGQKLTEIPAAVKVSIVARIEYRHTSLMNKANSFKLSIPK
jgi:hypothetical protein